MWRFFRSTPMNTSPPVSAHAPSDAYSAGLAAGISHLAGQGISNIRVLLVDDQKSVRQLISHELKRSGAAEVYEAADADNAVELFQRHRPDLVLLDIRLPGKDGYWVARRLRESENGDWTPIIFLSGLDNDLDVWQGIESGGDDYLVKPVKPIVLMAKLRAMQRLLDMRRRLVSMSAELRQANQRLNHMVEIDPLTGLVNRRGLDRILHTEMDAARREQQPLTLMLCDLDFFKTYNDTLGHVKGDECLREIGRLLQDVCVRPRDVAFRYGGEEFALLLPHTPRSGAMTFARALGSVLRKRAIAHPASTISPLLTISGGITTCIPDANTDQEGLIMRADQALYAAKSQGRDRFFSFEMQMDTIEQLRVR